MTTKRRNTQIDEIFSTCTNGSRDSVDFPMLMRCFWPLLDNVVSVVDIFNVFTVACQDVSDASLNITLFEEFFIAFAKLKYSGSPDSFNNMIDDFRKAKAVKIIFDIKAFSKMLDRNVIRQLLKYDLPLRRSFSFFAGHGVTVGGGLSWEEVKSRSIGMEADGYASFAASFGLIPQYMNIQQCLGLAKDVLAKFPLLQGSNSLHSALLYPQFQLLLCYTALERIEIVARQRAISKTAILRPFARKLIDSALRPMAEILNDLIKDMGIEKISRNNLTTKVDVVSKEELKVAFDLTGELTFNDRSAVGAALSGQVSIPHTDGPLDTYSSVQDKGTHAMHLRLEHLFDQISSKIVMDINSERLLTSSAEATDVTSNKLTSKPVVIGDALPLPKGLPESVEQLLEAALAHHNLGGYGEALKFLEAARVQLVSVETHSLEIKKKSAAVNPDVLPEKLDEEPILPIDIDAYILICKGNVYQSSGDDENAIVQYFKCWSRANADKHSDWEIICVNSIGMLAYYNLKYDISLKCFDKVVRYREETYGDASADTATAWNNEACTLFCIQHRSEARALFERAWSSVCKSLGHRHPRAVAIWKNLEKARRFQRSLSKKDFETTLYIRDDSSRLLLGGEFIINALPPPSDGKKGKGKKGKKGGGKKKK